MFGTLVYNNVYNNVYADSDDIRYGLDTIDGQHDMNLAFQFGLPFNKTITTND